MAEGNMSLRCVLMCAVVIILQPGGGSVCPESKKLYPRDCRLFYKCVPVPESAQAYVWVPSRCTAGLVYEPRLQRCVFPAEGWDCEQKAEDFAASFYSLNRSGSVEDGTKMTDYSAASTVQSGISASGFNDYDKSTKINFISDGSNKPSRDSIEGQMHRLTQLINSLKATSLPHEFGSDPAHSSPPFKRLPVQQLNLLQERIYKIMTQLISQTPYPATQQTNLDSPEPQTKYSAPEEIVGGLFRKYLSNSSSMKGGEFVKRSPHLEDCRKYHVRSGGVVLDLTCPEKTAFDAVNKVCEAEEFERCTRNCSTEGSLEDSTSLKHYLVCSRRGGGWVQRRVRCPGEMEYCVQKKICLATAYCH